MMVELRERKVRERENKEIKREREEGERKEGREKKELEGKSVKKLSCSLSKTLFLSIFCQSFSSLLDTSSRFGFR